jgi:hypothetical protein
MVLVRDNQPLLTRHIVAAVLVRPTLPVGTTKMGTVAMLVAPEKEAAP